MATYIAGITTSAPAQKVFDALTKPELVSLWQFGRVLSTTWEPGSAIRFSTGPAGERLEQWGTVLEVRANELVKYDLFTPRPGLEDKIEHYCVTSYVLTNANGQTRIEIIQEDNRPAGFIPQSLERILVSLREVAEAS